MDFLVERPPKEVLDRAEAYMARRRFHVHLSERTETTVLFTQIHIQRKGFLRTLLSSLTAAHTPTQKVRLLALRRERAHASNRIRVEASRTDRRMAGH